MKAGCRFVPFSPQRGKEKGGFPCTPSLTFGNLIEKVYETMFHKSD
jgi:hypothetical protein